ncbi:MAG: hypothetical protein FWD48_06990 [Oscillospiraceae bacterium]|nr:hypothetical protein [Oscillospiraceae bacterium]
MSKKLFKLLLIALICIIITACGNEQVPYTQAESDSNDIENDVNIALSEEPEPENLEATGKIITWDGTGFIQLPEYPDRYFSIWNNILVSSSTDYIGDGIMFHELIHVGNARPFYITDLAGDGFPDFVFMHSELHDIETADGEKMQIHYDFIYAYGWSRRPVLLLENEYVSLSVENDKIIVDGKGELVFIQGETAYGEFVILDGNSPPPIEYEIRFTQYEEPNGNITSVEYSSFGVDEADALMFTEMTVNALMSADLDYERELARVFHIINDGMVTNPDGEQVFRVIAFCTFDNDEMAMEFHREAQRRDIVVEYRLFDLGDGGATGNLEWQVYDIYFK